MHNLKPFTPLGADVPHVDEIGTVTLRERVEFALASVAARLSTSGDTHKAVKTKLGVSLPDVGMASHGDQMSAFWMGPDQWMIVASYDAKTDLASDVKAAVSDAASVVEQTDGWCRFDIQGAQVCDVLERLCNAPVRSMAMDAVVRSSLEHTGAFVWRTTDDEFAVIGPRSSAGSLHHALIAAARSVS
ncbi:sarcosine oxidase subunit gamma [Aliiroseovarius sp. 2305UL8-7]|uniref:sarcosine oxidase subunit gamma n=1 Tax=Aliiroseovarius conchicola TaxID=3121637 RepID=UPI003528DB4A